MASYKLPILSVIDENGNEIQIPAIQGAPGNAGPKGDPGTVAMAANMSAYKAPLSSWNRWQGDNYVTTWNSVWNASSFKRDDVIAVPGIITDNNSGCVWFGTVLSTSGNDVQCKFLSFVRSGMDGKTPEKGSDYWTAADQAKIVQDALAAIPNGDNLKYGSIENGGMN